MGIRARLFRAARWVPYVLLILLVIYYLIFEMSREFRSFEGSVPFLYEKSFHVCMVLLLVISVFARGAVRSVLVLISSVAMFSTELSNLFEIMRYVAIHAPPGTNVIPWGYIAFLGFLFLVAAIEAVMLVRSRADQPQRGTIETAPAIPRQDR